MITQKQIDNTEIKNCPFGCGVKGKLIIKSQGMVYGCDAKVECPNCGGRGPEYSTQNLMDESTKESGYSDGVLSAIDAWNKRG